MAYAAKVWDIRERTFEFSVRIVKLCRALEAAGISKTLAIQLIKAGTSVGANLEEAQGAQTKPDFIMKNSISLKEAREAGYWLRLIIASCDLEPSLEREVSELANEAHELARILGAIIVKAKT